MILKKPYAFFIKVFKPIHILMSALIVYLIYITNRILVFFNEYIYVTNSVIGENLKDTLISNLLYIIPIIIIVFSIIFLGILFNKKKNITFYVINIFAFLVVIIINVYVSNFLMVLENSIISIKIVKLAHDLIVISLIIQFVSFLFFLIRGLGLNFKKFNFDSDLTALNINDDDKEEFELKFNLDLGSVKSRRKRKLRYFKYLYKENKFIANISLFTILLLIGTSFLFYFASDKNKEEGIIYSVNNFNLRVNKSMLLNRAFNNNKITDNYLVVVEVSLQTNLKNISLYEKDFSIEIDEAIISVQNKYSKQLIDIGDSYQGQVLTTEYIDYLVVFEIPEKYIESDILFVYNNHGEKTKIQLTPQNYDTNKIINEKRITDTISFKDTLGDIFFSIQSFEIKEKFLIEYVYCIKKDDCLQSKEYIRPTINQNFDKYIIKLNVDFSNNSRLDINSFYDFFYKFGSIEYKIDGVLYKQIDGFEQLKSKKKNQKSNIYIGIDSNILNADSISLVFNIRDSKYIYILK